jgi:aconitase A
LAREWAVGVCANPSSLHDWLAEPSAAVHTCAGAKYDQLIEINLSELEPYVNGPFTPDLAHPMSKFADTVKKEVGPVGVAMCPGHMRGHEIDH